MTLSRTSTHLLATLGALTLGAGVLVGCTPEPAPTPTPTAAFASEEEAFAAAEEVYRAYNDAVNRERIDAAAADPQDYLVGAALQGSLDTTNKLDEQGLRIIGNSVVVSFVGVLAEIAVDSVVVSATVCLDVSATQILNGSGSDVTPPSRSNHVPLDVVFSGSEERLLISESNFDEESSC